MHTMPSHAAEDSMLHWLALSCAQARTRKGRKQVHIAAEISVHQSTIDRFEDAASWPRNPDEIVGAYARDLDMHPVDLWASAIQLWREWAEAPEFGPERFVGAADEAGTPPAETPRARERERQRRPARGR